MLEPLTTASSTKVTAERVPIDRLPPELRLLASRERGVTILQQIRHPSLYRMLSNPVSFFTTPLEEQGFVQAGQNAVGLVIQPRALSWNDQLMRMLTNSSTVLNAWGHTALYVRIDNRIVRVIGFDPVKISRDVILRGNAITEGRLTTPGHYNDDRNLFHNLSSRTVEYAIPRDQALEILSVMPNHGPAVLFPACMQRYVGSAGKFIAKVEGNRDLLVSQVGNCINFAVRTIETTLGAKLVGFNDEEEEVSVIDLGGTYNANQGRLVKQFAYVGKKKSSLILRVKGDGTEILPVLGKMPKSIVIIKGFKHAYLMTSVVRFTAPMLAQLATNYVLPTAVSSYIPSAPYLLQSGIGARHDTMRATFDAISVLGDQYIPPEFLEYLLSIGLLLGTAFLVYYGGESVDLVYGVWSYVWPYILELLVAGLTRT